MIERPILFSGPMVRALLNGTKTQTRRAVTRKPALDAIAVFGPTFLLMPGNVDLCPYGQPGDRLWVRETFARVGSGDPGVLVYKADYPACVPPGVDSVPPTIEEAGYRWKPSIHMPRSACRLVLEVTRVRVQRLQGLQGISEDDARAEGVTQQQPPDKRDGMQHWGVEGVPSTDPMRRTFPTAKMAYQNLWDGLNAKRGYGWDANPWVWAITFRRLKDAR